MGQGGDARAAHRRARARRRDLVLVADDSAVAIDPYVPLQHRMGARFLYGPPGGESLFTDNETNGEVVYGPGNQSRSKYTKDAFHRAVVDGQRDALRPEKFGTKAALHYVLDVKAGATAVLSFRLTDSECRAASIRWPASTSSSRRARQRPTSSTRASMPRAPPPTRSTSSGARSRGSCGRSRATSSTSRSGSTGTTPITRRRSRAGASATRTGAT